jgi:hypothetical protein
MAEGHVRAAVIDESALVERRVKPLLPKIGKRLGAAIPAVMAAARSGDVRFEPDGSVTLAGVTLACDEVEVQATPRPGTAVAEDDGLVVVLDTALTPGCARGRPRVAVASRLRKEAAPSGRPAPLWPRAAGPAPGHAPRSRGDAGAELAEGDPRPTPPGSVELDGGPDHRVAPPRGRPSLRGGGRDGRRIARARTGPSSSDRRRHHPDQLRRPGWSERRAGRGPPVVGDWSGSSHQNSGALFGLFRDQAILFGLLSIVVIAVIVGYHVRAGRSRYMSIALGFLLGGAVGNMIDRLRLGYVVDSAISAAIVLLVAVALVPGLARLVDGPPDA